MEKFRISFFTTFILTLTPVKDSQCNKTFVLVPKVKNKIKPLALIAQVSCTDTQVQLEILKEMILPHLATIKEPSFDR